MLFAKVDTEAAQGVAARAGIFYLDSVGHRANFDNTHLEIVSTLSALSGIALQHEDVRRQTEVTRRLKAQLDGLWASSSRVPA